MHTWSHAMDAAGYAIVDLHNQTHETAKAYEQPAYKSPDAFDDDSVAEKPEVLKPMVRPRGWRKEEATYHQPEFEATGGIDL